MRPNKYYSLEQDGSKVDIELYGDITSFPWLESDVSSYNLAQRIKGLTDVDEITVGINSYGGEVSEGLAIYNALKNSPAKVVTRCDGFACSAASIVFAAGDVRVMNEASLLMIHNAWSCVEGDAKALRKKADDLEKVTGGSMRAYMAIVNIGEEELHRLMDEETWIAPEEAVEMGFATEVLKAEDTDRASQSVRKKVFKMLKDQHRQEADDDPDIDTDPGEDPAPDDPGEAPGEEPEAPGDDPEDDPDDDQVQQFLTAIINM